MAADPSEAEWQNKEILSLQREAAILHEKMEGLRQQIRESENVLSMSAKSSARLSHVSTASGSVLPSSASSTTDDQQVDEQCRFRIQIVALEKLHQQLFVQKKAALLQEESSLARQLQRTETSCRTAEAHADEVTQRLNDAQLGLSYLRGTLAPGNGEEDNCSASMNLASWLRVIACTKTRVAQSSQQVAEATTNSDVANCEREILLRERARLGEELRKASQSHLGARQGVLEHYENLQAAALRRADEVSRAQVQLGLAAAEIRCVHEKRERFAASHKDANHDVHTLRAQLCLERTRNSTPSRLLLAQHTSTGNVDGDAIKVTLRDAEASAQQLKTLHSVALQEQSHLQAEYAEQLETLQSNAQALVAERRAFSVTAAQLHALAVEMQPHVAMLRRLLDEERAKGQVLRRQNVAVAEQHHVKRAVSLPTLKQGTKQLSCMPDEVLRASHVKETDQLYCPIVFMS